MAIDSKNVVTLLKSYSRANPLPIDSSELYDSLADAQNYSGAVDSSTVSGKAYAGQTIKALVDGKYVSYVLQPKASGEKGFNLERVGLDASTQKNEVQVITKLPATGEQGIIYINSTDKTGSIWNGTEYVQVFYHIENASTISSDVNTLKGDENTTGSVDNKIKTALNNYYTKEETKTEIATEIAAAGHITRTIVDALPTENISDSTIYMVKNANAADDSYQHYEEWMYINSKWEKIGDSATDLTNYYTKTETDNVIANADVPTKVQSAIDSAKNEAISTAATDATTKANAAKSDAISAVTGTDDTAKTTAKDGTVTYADTVKGAKAYAKDQADAAVSTANAHTDAEVQTVNTSINNKLDADKVGITFDEKTTSIKDYIDAQDALKLDNSKVGDIDFASSDTPTIKAYIDKTATGEKQTENIQGIAETKAEEVVEKRVGDLGTKEVIGDDGSTTTEKLTVKEYIDNQVADNSLTIQEF